MSEDKFTSKFKALKRRSPPADLHSVIDFYQLANNNQTHDKIRQLSMPESDGMFQVPLPHSSPASLSVGLRPPHSWMVYELISVPGVLFVRNPFTVRLRRYVIARCLADLSNWPNVTNTDAEYEKQGSNVWKAANSPGSTDEDKKQLHKLRWATLGYHYNWARKVYIREQHNEFPPDLAYILEYVANTVLAVDSAFKAETGIINYYHSDSVICGHTDHSEFDLTAPLVSVSFGLPCVFMIGGHTKAQEPEAMFLRDGDLVIMSGRSRLAYHSVPKILPLDHFTRTTSDQSHTDELTSSAGNCTEQHSASVNNFTEQNFQSVTAEHSAEPYLGSGRPEETVCIKSDQALNSKLDSSLLHQVENSEFWTPFDSYISKNRININARQMFHPGKKAEDYTWPDIDLFVEGVV